MPKTTLVIPCFNEAKRLRFPEFTKLLETPSIQLVFVNDGSTDDTELQLRRFSALHDQRVFVLSLPTNSGKGEAVRRGLLQAITHRPDVVGYADADLSTPVEELTRLSEILQTAPASTVAVIGSRVKLLGTVIERSPSRHYFGRLASTCISLTLKFPIYDSQCGAKFFRNTEAFRRLLEKPFRSRWLFDVELLRRLVASDPNGWDSGLNSLREIPLQQWKNVEDSKVTPLSYFRSMVDLIVLKLTPP